MAVGRDRVFRTWLFFSRRERCWRMAHEQPCDLSLGAGRKVEPADSDPPELHHDVGPHFPLSIAQPTSSLSLCPPVIFRVLQTPHCMYNYGILGDICILNLLFRRFTAVSFSSPGKMQPFFNGSPSVSYGNTFIEQGPEASQPRRAYLIWHPPLGIMSNGEFIQASA